MESVSATPSVGLVLQLAGWIVALHLAGDTIKVDKWCMMVYLGYDIWVIIEK